MTKYILKKDTPAFRSGYIFETDPKDKGILLDKEGVSAFYENEIENFDEWFEKVESQSFCSSFTHGYDEFDCPYVQVGFYTYNRMNANLERDRFTEFLQAVNAVSKDEGFMRKNGGGFGWPVIEFTTNNPGVEDIAERQHAGEFYFDTREHALDSAMNHTREWQTILNYDWSRE